MNGQLVMWLHVHVNYACSLQITKAKFSLIRKIYNLQKFCCKVRTKFSVLPMMVRGDQPNQSIEPVHDFV